MNLIKESPSFLWSAFLLERGVYIPHPTHLMPLNTIYLLLLLTNPVISTNTQLDFIALHTIWYKWTTLSRNHDSNSRVVEHAHTVTILTQDIKNNICAITSKAEPTTVNFKRNNRWSRWLQTRTQLRWEKPVNITSSGQL